MREVICVNRRRYTFLARIGKLKIDQIQSLSVSKIYALLQVNYEFNHLDTNIFCLPLFTFYEGVPWSMVNKTILIFS